MTTRLLRPLPQASLKKPHGIRSTVTQCAALASLLLLALAPVSSPTQTQDPSHSIHPPALTSPPDANAQMEMHQAQTAKQDYAAANMERKKQLAADTARLLALATELKDAVDKTNKDTLSVDVIRKASEIEKLAHDVRTKMKLVVGQG